MHQSGRIEDYPIGVAKDWQLSSSSPLDQLISLSDDMLKTHLLALGGTGSGKTTLFLSLIFRDMFKGHSIVVIDPRGDLVKAVLNMCAAAEVDAKRIRLLDLGEKKRPHGFNPLGGRGEPYFSALNVSEALEAISESWGVQLGETIWCGLMALAYAGERITRFEDLSVDPAFLERVLSKCSNESACRFWRRFQGLDQSAKNALQLPAMNKMSLLFSTETMMRVLSHPSPIDFGQRLDTPGSITLISLAIHELHKSARMIGAIIMSHICREVFSRADQPVNRRNPVRLYADEFEHFSDQDFDAIFSEGRRFGVSCCLAHQTLKQLNPKMRSQVLGNVGVKFTFRCSREDASTMCKDVGVHPDEVDLNNMPPGEALMWVKGYTPEVVELNEPIKQAFQSGSATRQLLDAIYRDSQVIEMSQRTARRSDQVVERVDSASAHAPAAAVVYENPRATAKPTPFTLYGSTIHRAIQPTKQLAQHCKASQSPSFSIFELVPTKSAIQIYRTRLIEALKSHGPAGRCADVPSPKERTHMRFFLTKDGQAGFALSDGRISSVFNHRSSEVRGKLRCLMGLAVQEGGWAIDVFDTTLPHLYGGAQFKTVCRMRWSDDHAPEGWVREAFQEFNRGRPDIVFMVHDPSGPRHYMPGEGKYVSSLSEARMLQSEAWNRLSPGGEDTASKQTTPKSSPSSALEDWLCN